MISFQEASNIPVEMRAKNILKPNFSKLKKNFCSGPRGGRGKVDPFISGTTERIFFRAFSQPEFLKNDLTRINLGELLEKLNKNKNFQKIEFFRKQNSYLVISHQKLRSVCNSVINKWYFWSFPPKIGQK